MRYWILLLAMIGSNVGLAQSRVISRTRVEDLPRITIADAPAGTPRLSDNDFLRAHFPSVFKDRSPGRRQRQLLHEMGLLTAEEKKQIFPRYSPEELEEALKPSLPAGLAQRIVSAYRTIYAKGLVAVAAGMTTQYDNQRRYKMGRLSELNSGQRSGVMTKDHFQTIYGDGFGDDAVAYLGNYTYQGKELQVPFDYADVLNYVEFACDFDENLKEWVPKYRKDSWELKIVNETQRALQEIYNVDILFDGASEVRKHVASQMNDLVQKAAQEGKAGDVVRREIIFFNLRRFYDEYKTEGWVKEELGENPSNRTLWDFYIKNRVPLLMAHGHYSKRLNTK